MVGSIIGAGIGLVANGVGAWLANKRKKQAEKIQDEYYKDAMADLDNEINSNYLDRADSRNALRKVTDANTEAMRQLNTDAIRGGATDEAKVAMASRLNKTTADVVGDLAAMGEQHKDALKAEKRGIKAEQANLKYQRLADTSGITNMVNGISSAANNLGKAWDMKKTMPDVDNGLTESMAENMPTQQDIVDNAHISVEDRLPNEEFVGEKLNNYQLRYGSKVF
jgi:hypothetical protein